MWWAGGPRMIYAAGLVLATCWVGACTSTLTAPDRLSAPPDAVVIEILGMNGDKSFSPNPVTVSAGRAVVWHNANFETHHIVLDGGLDADEIRPGRFSPPMMATAGGAYHCSIHPSMVGTLSIVEQTPAPYNKRAGVDSSTRGGR